MAKHTITVSVDMTEALKYMRLGQEQMFIALTDFDSLEKELNLNKIDFDAEEGS